MCEPAPAEVQGVTARDVQELCGDILDWKTAAAFSGALSLTQIMTATSPRSSLVWMGQDCASCARRRTSRR